MLIKGKGGLPIRWRVEDRKRLTKKYEIGQKITIVKTEIGPASREEKREKIIRAEAWEVIEKHKHHVLCRNEKGTRESFKYFELEQIAVQKERPADVAE